MKEVVVYSKERCPYCVRAKDLLRKKGVSFREIDVEKTPGARDEMQKLGGGMTVPQIFADGEYVGDCERLYKLEGEGRLDRVLGIESNSSSTGEGSDPARGEEETSREGERIPNDAPVEGEVRNVIIIGAGPAGYTAGLYASRANLNPLLFSGLQPGGQLMITTEVENFPGFPEGIQGPQLMQQFREQAAKFGTEIVDATVSAVDLTSAPKRVLVDGKVYPAKSVIIATGASAKWLGIPGEEPANEGGYGGRGVSACATCDGFFFREKDIAVVGGGDTAMEEALFLTNFGKTVTVIHRRDELRASQIMQERARKNPKMRWLLSHTVSEVLGDGTKMTGLLLKNLKTGEECEKPFDALFVAIGHKPNTDVFQGQLNLDAAGYVVVPNPGRTATDIEGVFAAGDVTDNYYRQAVTAAGMGCMAAIEAERWLAQSE